MMDEVWSRGWSHAHKAALQAREASMRDGRPVPTLWGDLRTLVCDLIAPPVPAEVEEGPGDPATCQSAA